MSTKILSFKFTKKEQEPVKNNSKLKKKYENIFNEILNGEKKNENLDNKKEILNENKKNTIKCISKINYINIQELKNQNIYNYKEENNNLESDNKNHSIKNIYKTQNNLNDKKQDNQNNININKTNNNLKNNLNILLSQKIDDKKNSINAHLNADNNICNKEEKNIIILPKQNIKKNYQKIDSNKESIKNNNNKNKVQRREVSLNKKNRNKKCNTNNIKKYQLSHSKFNALNINNLNIKGKKVISNEKKKNKSKRIYNDKNKVKNITYDKIENLIYINSKNNNNHNNYLKKVNIKNNNISEKSNSKKNLNSFNYSLKNSSKSRKLILNNAHSNINININITNIGDKNINKKDSEFSKKHKNFDNITNKNNSSNNIATVNIINNNNYSKKINDYNLLFFEHSNKRRQYLDNVRHSKGIKIREINIDLIEDENNNNLNNNRIKNKSKNKEYRNDNLTNDNYFKMKEIDNEKKQCQSEYECLYDYEDFQSNKSLTNFSCKSGLSANRRLRSLSRERNRIKILNKLKKENENDIEKIGNKLFEIVTNFHKNDINKDFKIKRKSLKELNKKYL